MRKLLLAFAIPLLLAACASQNQSDPQTNFGPPSFQGSPDTGVGNFKPMGGGWGPGTNNMQPNSMGGFRAY